MADVLTIVTGEAPILTRPAQPVAAINADVLRHIDGLQATLCAFRERHGHGRAMAAPQAGIGLRIIVAQLGGRPIAMINPHITWRSGEMQEVWDDCLSLPSIAVKVLRHMSISLAWLDERGRERHWQHLPPDMAELFQHEIDHLDGILMTARAMDDRAIRSAGEGRRLIDGQRPVHRLSLERIGQAARILDPVFRQTPQYECPSLSARLGCRTVLKVETLNPLRCFKGRGAGFLLAQAAARGESRPLVTASAGNWGLALAYHCALQGRPLTVFTALNANPAKLDAIRYYGADIRQTGHDFDSAKAQARDYSAQTGAWFVEDGFEPNVSEGAGTIAVELLAGGDHYDAVFVPVGNGALISGMARWLKASAPDIRVIGVCPRNADAMYRSWLTRRVVSSLEAHTKADGLAVRVPVPEALEDMRGVVDDIVLANEEQIALAAHYALKYAGLILEPSGAAALAGILAYAGKIASDSRVAAILTGANLNPSLPNALHAIDDASPAPARLAQ
ncbi:pyridoxal-phosphate dependent enzyme [Martelella alba]|uniref:Peptide deformylase n=1 Tax=Martelella alba TaxID=2590451 RepID=A0ABY2SNQ1_9HYPH|nr:pyridoxal-phosphate dependent enzyme [Martelella alba]TKI06732.1 pyridoxal-phosphate dependent enzyme [Martelella alba]